LLVEFLYTHPTWLIGLVVIGIWTGVSLAGLYLFHRLVDVHMRHKDTETVGLTYAIVAVVYAVLIAFIVVDVFETFAKGDEIATAEAIKLSNLMLDSAGLPPQVALAVRGDLDKYIDIVVKSEWPSQQKGKLGEAVFESGWTTLAHLSTRLAVYEPATMGQNVNKGEMLHVMNDLIRARRSRILAAGEHLPTLSGRSCSSPERWPSATPTCSALTVSASTWPSPASSRPPSRWSSSSSSPSTTPSAATSASTTTPT
jgi:hypothetical protein